MKLPIAERIQVEIPKAFTRPPRQQQDKTPSKNHNANVYFDKRPDNTLRKKYAKKIT